MTNGGSLGHPSDSSLPAMSELLQQLILHHLDTHGSLSDTRSLSLPGSTAQATDADAQITVLGALNSLLSREVSDQ
jgi:phenylalanyl-tRNA synthetase alpha chain